jgi:hypothetical protein
MSKPEIEVTFDERQSPPPASGTPVRQLQGLIRTVATEPTGTPRSFFEQFVIFDGALWFYDTLENTWQSASGGGGGTITVQSTDNDHGGGNVLTTVLNVHTINVTAGLFLRDNGDGTVDIGID